MGVLTRAELKGVLCFVQRTTKNMMKVPKSQGLPGQDHMAGIAKGPSPDHRRVHARGGDSRLGREVLASLPCSRDCGGPCLWAECSCSSCRLSARPCLAGPESKSWVCKTDFLQALSLGVEHLEFSHITVDTVAAGPTDPRKLMQGYGSSIVP